MSSADFSALTERWHDFYLTAGAASATLVGLLFVGMSINIDVFTDSRDSGLRILAEQAFSNFVFVLLISLFLLIPEQEPQSVAIEVGIAGGLGLFRFVRRIRSFNRRSDPFGGWIYVLRRLGLPAAASAGLLIIAASIVSNPISSLYWLLAIVLVFLTSAADSSWDLLIEVGRERRRAH
jgi:hypothetical protein